MIDRIALQGKESMTYLTTIDAFEAKTCCRLLLTIFTIGLYGISTRKKLKLRKQNSLPFRSSSLVSLLLCKDKYTYYS